jgi:amidohydrolase
VVNPRTGAAHATIVCEHPGWVNVVPLTADDQLILIEQWRHGTRTVALRADIDALPIHEQTGAPYASRHPGAMHACGHDAHTAMALSAAEILAKDAPTLHGNLFFVFQPAEELLVGAAAMTGAGITPDIGFGSR